MRACVPVHTHMGVEIAFASNAPTLALLEGRKGHGVLAAIDEECAIPRGSDDGFLSKLLDKHAPPDTKSNAKKHPPPGGGGGGGADNNEASPPVTAPALLMRPERGEPDARASFKVRPLCAGVVRCHTLSRFLHHDV